MRWHGVAFYFSAFTALLQTSSDAQSTLCEDWSSFQTADDQEVVMQYCKQPGTKEVDGKVQCFVILVDAATDDYRISCTCNEGYALPDCSLEEPAQPSSGSDPNNETVNTSWIEDLLQVNQGRNDFSIYGQYVTSA